LLNRGFAHSLKKRFPRWMECTALLIGLEVWSAQAQQANAAAEPVAAPVVSAPAPDESDPTKTNAFFLS